MIYKLFLEALQASLKNEKVNWEHDMSSENWKALFGLAEEQNVLPMVYDAVYSCPSVQDESKELFASVKRKVYQKVMLQALKTDEFLKLYEHLKNSGLEPVVVKGLICRQLYPNPDYRKSSDEDLVVEADKLTLCHKVLMEYGMAADPDKTDVESYDEIGYRKEGGPLYIELHKTLFSAASEAYGDLNRYFEDLHQNKISIAVGNADLYAMSHTDHLLYLILHAYKHFLHSGVGIRQVCDITLYANEYGNAIDWADIVEKCTAIRAVKFAFALLKIGKIYFGLSSESSCCPDEIFNADVNECDLLHDILSGGVYGGATSGRKHSSNVTLNAVSSQKKGNGSRGSVLRTILPPISSLSGRYKYLKKYPFLLPAAWCGRIFEYIREMRDSKDLTEAAKIGKERIELLRKYEIID